MARGPSQEPYDRSLSQTVCLRSSSSELDLSGAVGEAARIEGRSWRPSMSGYTWKPLTSGYWLQTQNVKQSESCRCGEWPLRCARFGEK